ncbi:BppU family phage baseplate upper protein [Agathobaculum sp. NTUH-O15-33]|uniref:BppU family phage baseplate upper protein n=1 Tax=Agathobaculum sp. NTUH-O15-33 TaxID=3079302 RepID=UPI0029585DD1|nr:BppU family phage baseplate upper protein [Agathobaculum sp. NTUH-O15-33]WNX85261.1 BppU family phage baseplate upper protein [Agathobaculum sp. NTUH-O15-33]
MLVETHNILLDVTDPRVLDTALTLVRNDVKANVLHIQLAGVDDWSNVTGIIKYLRSDGSCIIDDVAITSGYVDHVVPVAALNVAGEVRCEVALMRDGARATTNQIIFTVRADIDSDGVKADDRFPVLEKALEQIKEIDSVAILNAEKERGTAEQQRQANEVERQRQEEQREADHAEMLVWEPYDPETQYQTNNKVSLNGSSYACKVPCRGIMPPDDRCWVLIAARGDKGERGKDGKVGKTGEQGPQGLRGDSGITTPVDGFYTLYVNDDGDLIARYPASADAPPLSIRDGLLILTV